MTATKTKEFIEGSTGGKDYLVVSKKDNLIIGVKAVMEPVMKDQAPALLIGIRVRVVAENGSNILNVGHVAKTIFPDFTFQKTEKPNYCSSFIGSMTNPFPDGLPWDKFEGSLVESGFITNALDMLGSLVNVSPFYYTKEELLEYVKESYQTMFTAGVPVVEPKNKATLIPFPSQLDK
jgi:hypothetical protein